MNNCKLFWICTIIFITYSCGGDGDASHNQVPIEQEIDKDTTQISSTLTMGQRLLSEIEIHLETPNNATSNIIDTLFQSIHSSIEDGFALMCKFKSGNKKGLKTLVFDRNVEGDLIQKNAFDAILLGKDTIASDYPKILLRFVEFYGETDRYYYNCWFAYDQTLDKYIFEHCASINKAGEESSYFDVYVSDAESIEDQLLTDNEVLSILEKNRYLN